MRYHLDGMGHVHTFDFHVELKDGTSRAIAVRPTSRTAALLSVLRLTLEMAVMDKSRLQFLLGNTPWIGHGIPEHVVTDGGAAFISFEFRRMLTDLGVSHSLPPGGEAKLRPYIESVFKTLSVQFLHWFEGRTFSDYIEKGEYDPGENASVCVDELNRDFVVGVQHVYNNQPHAGLAGETPHNAFLRLSRKYGVIPPPSRDIQRHVFGVTCSRTIGDKGICILGIHYNSRQLQDLRVTAGQAEVRVRFDRFDLWRISAWNGVGWFTVGSSFGLPEDLSVWEWVGAAQELRRIHAENAKENLSSMYEAINRLRASGDAAAARAELGASVLSEKRIKDIERRHFRSITVVDDLKSAPAGLVPIESPRDPLMAGIDAFPESFAESAAEDDQADEAEDINDGAAPSQLGGVADLKFDDEDQ
ncbi:Mu transposase C-terminal domain-containing protein [Mesorhizobium sp. MSK_1335]|uniref:Mu transposase C-terminal domain-containing protein n=1 Tax=Mesorhizobium montanum TaxID=3072323 RepID=A0ABU4ZUX7_9HYPH|nr:Mu transposase C-terminal domain-containing protein [Mesorhizobium sp. MSK_1335]MDX8528222.1 Mu transposase C-terminal domain-containing protein [Mesorhizobium sp. MSK_1335]